MRLPTVMVTAAAIATKLVHSVSTAGKAAISRRIKAHKAGQFGSRGQERGDRCGRPFIDVGSPKMQRGHRDFEAKADQHQN